MQVYSIFSDLSKSDILIGASSLILAILCTQILQWTPFSFVSENFHGSADTLTNTQQLEQIEILKKRVNTLEKQLQVQYQY